MLESNHRLPFAALAVAFLLIASAPPAAGTTIPCPTAAENCVASDVSVSFSVEAYLAGDGTCDSTADTVEILVDFVMIETSGNSKKYDIGMYAQIGADTSSCQVELLEAGVLKGTDFDGDVCVDLAGGDEAAHSFEGGGPITIPCTDDNGDGVVDSLLLAMSWAQGVGTVGGGDALCTINNVAEGTTAKCYDELVNTGITVPICGDGQQDAGEECDDGNETDNDFCDNTCMLPVCGDNDVEGSEECDDGNKVDDDACGNDCLLPVCGDSAVEGNEECDDGNVDDMDACTNGCLDAVCGDGVTWTGQEECDDGNENDDDACGNDCLLPVCGDGEVEGSEQCDDGNNVDLDGCSAECIDEVPTMSEWGLILLALILGTLGVLVMRRQRIRL